jgi:hypothetical protein
MQYRWCIPIAVVALPSVLLGQGPEQVRVPGRRTEPIRVALVASDTALSGSHVRVLRRNQQKPFDVILVSPQATSRDLATGVQLFSALRAQHGDSLLHDIRATPISGTPPLDWDGSPYQIWMDQQLTRLRRAQPYDVGGIGVARAVMITVPAARGRVSVPKQP